jgi:phosphoribosylamine---glycine ligase
MRALVVGGGGREHALAWGLAASPGTERLIAAPGNPGIAQVAECMPVPADDLDGLVQLATGEAVDLVVVGPEAPLVAGLADRLRERGVVTFGPDADAARLEGSKAWAKSVMEAGGIPTARAGTFADLAAATSFVDELGGRAVVKADGLAAGKGVTVAADRETAVRALRECLEGDAFGAAGSTVVVEEVLEGREVSAFALCDGATVVPLSLSQDFKRIGDDDTGPNTGGMGAYAPFPFVDAGTEAEIWAVADRTVRTLASMGVTYRGLLYVGLMLTAGGPKVLEYNCRFGDPETEVVVPRLGADLGELLHACATGSLEDVKVGTGGDAAVTVVLASGGYPGTYRTGLPIAGLEAASAMEGVVVFHAGTARQGDRVVTSGGRVLAVTALGSSIARARERAYEACSAISFEGMTYRSDIAATAARDLEA